MKNDVQYTIKFLSAISSRLSGRDDCKDIEYLISVDESHHVMMEPSIYIYPNRHTRKESDKITILQHVCYQLDYTSMKQSLVPGRYRYKKSVTKKQRRWAHDSQI